MQTGFILMGLLFPALSEACCVRNQQQSKTAVDHRGLQHDATHLHYKAVEGEIFMVPCRKAVSKQAKAEKLRTGECRAGNQGSSLNCGKPFIAEAKHSGNYTCDIGMLQSVFADLTKVLGKESLGCFHPNESNATLLIAAGGIIPCPGGDCRKKENMSAAIWYKDDKAVSTQRRASCELNEQLHLCQVSKLDAGAYFCDRKMTDRGTTWTFRRAVKVDVISFHTATYPPKIVDPDSNTTKEVELGQSYTLTCKVYFPDEMHFSPNVWWFMNCGGKSDNVIRLHLEKPQLKKETYEVEVIQTAIIKEVTPQHLMHTYTCIASNAVGNSTSTIELKKKIKVKWSSLVGYSFVGLLLLTGVGVILHVKWLELQLFYRSHFQHGKHDEGKKEFDVFLSYVWRPPSAQVEGDMTLSGPDTNEEACLSSMDPLNIIPRKDAQRPLEVLLPQVLEDRWGYRLCLLERDVLPGGAYADDVVLAIQRSRMLICLLSADYLCDSNAVFILESGIKALLHNSALKLLLIWTSRTSTSFIQPEPPLPTVVQRALKVLPSLDWASGNLSGEVTCSFWKSLRKAMPDHREQSWFQV